jgi:uncharacterized protein YkwD
MRTLLLAVAIAAASFGVRPDGAAARPCSRVRSLINAERSAHGLHPLAPDRRLARAARAHASDMVRRRYFSHVSPDGRGLVDRVRRTGWLSGRPLWFVGEDLAWGIGRPGTPAGIVRAWMHSPSHRRIILSSAYRRVGIGAARGTPVEPSRGRTVAADFGS